MLKSVTPVKRREELEFLIRAAILSKGLSAVNTKCSSISRSSPPCTAIKSPTIPAIYPRDSSLRTSFEFPVLLVEKRQKT